MRNLPKRELLTLLTLFFIWKLFIIVTAYFAPLVIPEFGAKFPYYNERLIQSGLPYFMWSFGNFDGVHYLGIAKDGYVYQFTQAFFPLYPALFAAISYITGLNLVVSGLLISNSAFLFGFVIFYFLVKDTFNRKTALWSCTFLLAFPTSFYFGSIYTEGLFFFLTIFSFYLLSKNKVLLASTVGLLASSTRLVGIFLSVTLQRSKKANFAPILLVPLGLLVYMLYLKIKFNNAIYFLTSQSAFGQQRSTTEIILLPQVVYRWTKQIATTSGLTLFNSILELTTLLFVLALLIVAWKRMNRQWVIFAILSTLTPTLTGSLASMPRYVLIAFPIFIVLAQIQSKYVKVLITIGFIVLLAISTTFFTRGYWIA